MVPMTELLILWATPQEGNSWLQQGECNSRELGAFRLLNRSIESSMCCFFTGQKLRQTSFLNALDMSSPMS